MTYHKRGAPDKPKGRESEEEEFDGVQVVGGKDGSVLIQVLSSVGTRGKVSGHLDRKKMYGCTLYDLVEVG